MNRGDEALADRVRAGEVAVLGRAATLVENGTDAGAELLRALRDRLGRAWRVGITGPPGAGKSTLVARLARHLRAGGRRVGIVAVDPSSPFTGGALLGDRLRMGEVAGDEGVFIRSMASRGAAGGIAAGAGAVCDLLDAAGFDVVFIETVGVGQAEVAVAGAADVTVAVLHEGGGDSVQAMKAGLLEVADLFCVNKADREGAERFAADLREGLMLALGPASREREIVLTAAIEDRGVVDLWSAVERARAHLLSTGAWEDRRRRRAREAVRQAADELRAAAFWTDARRAALERLAAENLAGRLSPWEAARRLAGDPDANPA